MVRRSSDRHGLHRCRLVTPEFKSAKLIVADILDIGSQIIARSLNCMQHQALKELAQHLKGIQKLVQALGQDALEQFCQEGYLPIERVQGLENLEANLLADEEGSSDEEEGVANSDLASDDGEIN